MSSRRTAGLVALALGLVIAGALAVRATLDRSAGPAGRSGSQDDMAGMDMDGMNMRSDESLMLTAEQVRTFGVTFGSVERRALDNEIRTVGIVNFDETRLAAVTPKFDGYVERLYVDFTGQPVRAGQPLAEIYSPALLAAQEELLLAARLQRSMEGSSVPGVPGDASDLVSAARRKLRLLDITDERIDGILQRGEAQRTVTLHAPVGGIVIDKNVLSGEAVVAGRTLYTIADLAEVWIEAELREADAAIVQTGDSAVIVLAALPGRAHHGTVEFVYPTLQAEARSLKARVAVPNPGGRLKPGMYATVRIMSPTRTALTVPSAAVLETGDRTIVFVDLGGGLIAPQDVELGRRGAAYVEVLAGLEPGQRIVTSAQYLLDSESNLAQTMRSMIGMSNMSDMGSMEGMEGMDMGPGADMRGIDTTRREP